MSTPAFWDEESISRVPPTHPPERDRPEPVKPMSPPRVGESPVHRQYNPSLASINELYQTGTQRQYYGYNDYCDSGSVYSESMSMHSHSSARPLLPERFRPVAVTVAPPSANVQSQSHVVEDDAASVYSSGTSGPFRIRTDSGYRVSSALPPIWFPEEEDESQPKHNSGSDTLNSGNSDDRDRWTRTTLSPPISPYSPFASIAEKRSSSIYAFNPPQDDKGSQNLKPIDTTPPESVKPSMLSLLTLIPLRDAAKSLLPAVILSTATGLVTPYMALMVGNAFSALAAFPTDPKLATDALKAKLLKDVGHTSMLFAIAGLLGVIGSYFATIFWVRYSESSTAALRWMVFMGVEGKPMYWFDTGMGLQEDANKVGAGGLMTKFTRETDDVRLATAMLGSMIKAASSVAVCIGLAFAKQPLVSLVLLSVLPAIQILNLVNGHLQEPLYRQERRGFAQASTLIERTTKDVATVKVFNAQELEKNKFVELVNTARDSLYKQAIGWASLIAGVSFTMLTMFVAGFWYGAVLVSKGKVGVSAVMTAIWACLLASSNIQTVMTQMTTVSKGKTSLASLLSVIQEPLQTTKPWRLSALSMTPPKLRRPARCHGSFEVSAVYFAYPTRPDVPVLRGVDLFVAAGELTFIVGGSGSGKSTIAQLLLRMYPPTAGSILLDERDITAISDDYCREHVAAVQQGCILFDMSVHDNVALGVNTQRCTWLGRHRRPEDVTRDEVEEACKMADIHDFIMSLPDGYETKLGSSGTQLSGGQRQRLAIGRARIRNPTVLILDEATSALDATSRVVVFEAIRKWRQDRTTIVITHDLSQILPDDFIFVMKDGIVAEQGFQRDLMEHKGVYSGMAADQAVQPLRPRILNTWHDGSSVEELLVEEMNREELLPLRPTSVASFCGQTVSHSRPLSQIDFQTPKVNRITFDRPPSMVKKSPPSAYNAPSLAKLTAKTTRSALETTKHRMSRRGSRRTFKTLEHSTLSQATLNSVLTAGEEPDLKIVRSEYSPPPVKTSGMFAKLIPKVQLGSTYRLLRTWYPSVPNKRLLSVGLAAAMTSGVCKPLWSYQIAKLVALMSAGDKGGIARLAGIVLAISVGQAASEWIEYWAMRRLAAQWTALLRGQAFAKVIEQEKAWFDAEGHSPSALAQILIKDVEDMSSLVGTVIAGAVVVIVMSNVTVIWALVVGWKLTLIGAALGPVIAGVMVVTNITTGRAEVQNKGYREALAKTFYECAANIRGIRSMALEDEFRARFERETRRTEKHAVRAAWVTSIGSAFAFGMTLFTQALMNYAGAWLIQRGEMTFEQMLQVYMLILFTVAYTTQVLGFLPLIAKSRAAANDFMRLHTLDTDTSEKIGTRRFPIRGEFSFENVHFSYPSRPHVPVLRGLTLRVSPNECVALVGSSGSGKSTIAALLQRLHEPSAGAICMGENRLSEVDVNFLRYRLGLVSQTPSLIDASVHDNVSYGNRVISRTEVERACREAHIHEYIMSLPQGYETQLGENGSLLSGGQAQRLMIARAFARDPVICVFDESTSALDVTLQRQIIESIQHMKKKSTVIFITHNIEVMKGCDRIVCIDNGRVADDGRYDQLIQRDGAFARLVASGEVET